MTSDWNTSKLMPSKDRRLRRREFITLLGGAAAWPLAARAQQMKLPTIGLLGGATASAQAKWTAAFVERLRELGWVEGQTVAIEYRWVEGRFERSPAIIAEFVRLKVDVIVTHATPNVVAAKQVTSVIPIVFPSAGDPVFEVFFGGARGGGKTDGVLGEFGAHASRYGKDAIGLMVRRTRAELVETIERSRAIYGPLRWEFNETEKMWRAPDGARLRFAYLERDADADLYQGHSYTRVYIEEAGNFPNPAPVLKLMATLRSGAGVPVGLRATGNPGGPGHQWVKARYIDPAPLGNRIIRDPLTGLERVFIPSKVDNNQHIDVEAYKQRLRASGSQELVRAWLDGDWSVTMGAFFDCWEAKRHVVAPFAIPERLDAVPVHGLGLGFALLRRVVGDRAG